MTRRSLFRTRLKKTIVYNTIVESIIGELVNDGIIVRQQKGSTSDDPVDRCEIIQKSYKKCKTLGVYSSGSVWVVLSKSGVSSIIFPTVLCISLSNSAWPIRFNSFDSNACL